MKVLVIEMQRSAERTLPSGERTTLVNGQRYTLPESEAAPFLRATKKVIKDASISGGLRAVDVPPVAVVIEAFETPDPENADHRKAQEARAESKAAARRTEQESDYFASETERLRIEAIERGETEQTAAPVATPATDVDDDG